MARRALSPAVSEQRKPLTSGFVVETMGLEPTTPCLQSRCSSQLSYVPWVLLHPIEGLLPALHKDSYSSHRVEVCRCGPGHLGVSSDTPGEQCGANRPSTPRLPPVRPCSVGLINGIGKLRLLAPESSVSRSSAGCHSVPVEPA